MKRADKPCVKKIKTEYGAMVEIAEVPAVYEPAIYDSFAGNHRFVRNHRIGMLPGRAAVAVKLNDEEIDFIDTDDIQRENPVDKAIAEFFRKLEEEELD